MTQQGNDEEPRAVVREINGQIVLDDPDALALMQAVGKHNCASTLALNADRVAHFKQRFVQLDLVATDVVIVVINVDDVHGKHLAEALMPGVNWQEIRDRGEVPFARGLASKSGIQEFLSIFDKEASIKLMMTSDLCVVVVDHGAAEVYIA